MKKRRITIYQTSLNPATIMVGTFPKPGLILNTYANEQVLYYSYGPNSDRHPSFLFANNMDVEFDFDESPEPTTEQPSPAALPQGISETTLLKVIALSQNPELVTNLFKPES